MSHLAKLLLSIPQAAPSGLPVAPAIGTAWQGGFYGGKINIDGTLYGLVVSPKATGNAYLVYRTSGAAFTGNTSTYDGWAIRANMIAAGIDDFPAQKACMGLTIGGFTDWYIGSKLEMEILYRNLKPTTGSNNTSSGANAYAVPPTSNYSSTVPARTTVTAFRAAGAEGFDNTYYYSATQGPSGNTYAHGKLFTSGADGEDLTPEIYGIRAIRRVAIAS